MNGSYNADDAHRLAVLSRLAYLPEQSATREAFRLGADHAQLVERHGTECLVCQFGPDVYLAFRGTEHWAVKDYLTDARIQLVSSELYPGKTHAGFADSVAGIYWEVTERVLAYLQQDSFIHIGGHSKGGAEAVLYAKSFEQKHLGSKIGSVHVFGAPAVGNREFSEAYDDSLGHKTFCHTHRSDWVARSPVLLRFFGRFRPVGQRVYHYGNGKGFSFRPSPIRKIVDGLRAISRKRAFVDHFIGHYESATKLEMSR